MNQYKKTTLRLTFTYSLVFFCFLWAFSGGLYLWTNNALGTGYVNRINDTIERSTTRGRSSTEFADDTAIIAAGVALDRLRNILFLVNGAALVIIPTLAYYLSRRSLQPLIHSQARQQQFITNASHELRTPLAIMSGELELAAKKDRSKEEYMATIKNTQQEVERMTKLVHELLLLTRTSSDSQLQHLSTVDLSELLHQLTTLYQPMATKKHVRLIIEHNAKTTVLGRVDLLVIALGNLVENAIKFANTDSDVIIRSQHLKHSVVIAVKNRGQMIPPDTLPHLFERFYQANANHTEQGFGLGLAITKQIIELHHGVVEVESQHEETVFSVYLPSGKQKDTTGS